MLAKVCITTGIQPITYLINDSTTDSSFMVGYPILADTRKIKLTVLGIHTARMTGTRHLIGTDESVIVMAKVSTSPFLVDCVP